jgi:hypothetical protein
VILGKRKRIVINEHFLYLGELFLYVDEFLDDVFRAPLPLSPPEHLLWIDAECTSGIAAAAREYGNERVSAVCIKIVFYR